METATRNAFQFLFSAFLLFYFIQEVVFNNMTQTLRNHYVRYTLDGLWDGKAFIRYIWSIIYIYIYTYIYIYIYIYIDINPLEIIDIYYKWSVFFFTWFVSIISLVRTSSPQSLIKEKHMKKLLNLKMPPCSHKSRIWQDRLGFQTEPPLTGTM